MKHWNLYLYQLRNCLVSQNLSNNSSFDPEGGSTPLYGLYKYVWHQRVWFLSAILVINWVLILANLSSRLACNTTFLIFIWHILVVHFYFCLLLSYKRFDFFWISFMFFFCDPIHDPIRDPIRDPVRDPVRNPIQSRFCWRHSCFWTARPCFQQVNLMWVCNLIRNQLLASGQLQKDM